MTDPRDDLDAWLEARVHPLPPPPGTFELIRRRARQRKVRRAAMAAAGAAAAITLIAAVPTLIIPRLQPGSGQGQNTAATGQTQPASTGHGSATPSTAASTATPVVTQPPVPPNFAATSVTFIGTDTGWVLGQAGIPGNCPIVKQDCTSIARTDDGGATWYGSPAPVTTGPEGATGVSQIRFLDRDNGWAFGPELFATHDGGQTWTHVSTGGMRVTALETRGNRAFAVLAQCTGTGSDFDADCTSFAVASAPASSNTWVPVAGATAAVSPGAAASSVSLLLTGTSGYLLTPSGDLLSGPVSGQGAWQPLTTPAASAQSASPSTSPSTSTSQCAPGSASPDGQPATGMLAATNASGLVLLCTGQAADGSQVKTVYTSSDSGTTWHLGGTAPAAGTATSVAGTPSGTLVVATSLGLEISTDGGATWTAADTAVPPGGFAFVGMTTSLQGVAVPADPHQYAVWFTMDGGQNWQASPIK
jgi:hypothetical protein